MEEAWAFVHFTTEITFCSCDLLNLHFDVHLEKAERLLRAFCQRRSADRTIGLLKDLVSSVSS